MGASVDCQEMNAPKKTCPQPPQPFDQTQDTATPKKNFLKRTAKCSGTSCFSIKLEGESEAHFDDATVPSGSNYGVDVYYGKDHRSLFASIWDSDGDKFVNITDGQGGHCVIDITGGAAYYPGIQ